MNDGLQPAIGFLELKGAVHGMTALDVVNKAAVVHILQTQVVCPGKFTVLFTGKMAAVSTAHAAALARVGSGLYDSCLIGRIHPDLGRGLYGMFAELPKGEMEALGILETLSMAAGIKAADAALKAGAVELRELRLGYALGGRSYFAMSGATSAVEASLAAALEVAVERGSLGSHCIIPRPAKALYTMSFLQGGIPHDYT